jgi:hypothetical protein
MSPGRIAGRGTLLHATVGQRHLDRCHYDRGDAVLSIEPDLARSRWGQVNDPALSRTARDPGIVTSALWPVSRFVTLAVVPSGSVLLAALSAFGFHARAVRHFPAGEHIRVEMTQCRCVCIRTSPA